MYTENSHLKPEYVVWLKRLGWLGLLFFLVKGVLWLTLPLILIIFGMGY